MTDFKFRPLSKGLGIHEIHRVKRLQKNSFSSSSVKITEQSLKSPNFTQPPLKVPQKKVAFFIFSSFAKRAAAFAIDFLLLAFLNILFFSCIFFIFTLEMQQPLFVFKKEFFLLFALFYSASFVLYFSIFDLQQTMGKKIFHLRVLDEEKKIPLNFSDSFLRTLYALIPIFLLFNLHDKMSQSQVFEERV